jgi:hypothetical protein
MLRLSSFVGGFLRLLRADSATPPPPPPPEPSPAVNPREAEKGARTGRSRRGNTVAQMNRAARRRRNVERNRLAHR